MKKLFNYTIAAKRLDKGFKACYRYSKYDSCIYDSSYYNYLLIDTVNDNVIPLFEKILTKFSLSNFWKIQKFQIYKINLYNNDYCKRLIGPCSFILMENSIIITYHPLMKEEIVKLFKSFNQDEDQIIETKFYFNNKLNNLTLLGPRVGENIYKILKSLTPQNDDRNILSKFNNEDEFIKFLNMMNENQFVIFEISNPRSCFRMNEFIFRESTKEILEKLNNEDVINQINSLNYDNKYYNNLLLSNNSTLHENLRNSIFKNSYIIHTDLMTDDSTVKENPKHLEIPTERTVFMHRKKAKLEDINKKLENSIRQKRKKDKIIKLQEKKLNTSDMQCDEFKSIFSNTNEKICLILTKTNLHLLDKCKNLNTPIFNLIFPKGHALDLLRRFVYLETRPIGLKEYKYYLTNSDSFIFPDDYPSTLSYQSYIKEKTLRIIDKYCRFPSSKRVNFQKIGNPYPFYAAWHRLGNISCNNNSNPLFYNFNKNVEIVSDLANKEKLQRQFKLQNIIEPSSKIFLIPVLIEMTGKGIPDYNSLICIPNPDDISKYKLGLEARLKGKNNIKRMLKIENNKYEIDDIQINFNDDPDDDKILEKKHKTEIRNKYFNTEFLAIKNEILSKTEEDNLVSFSSAENLNVDLTIKIPDEKGISREVIGFVTSGQFSYTNSKGIAKGFINVRSFENLNKINRDDINKIYPNNYDSNSFYRDKNAIELIALVRKKISRNYYFAKMRTIKMNNYS